MKTNIKITSVALFGLFFISATCCRNQKDCHYNVYIKNNSDRAIYFLFSTSYPDTFFYDNPIADANYYKLNPRQETHDSNNSCVEGYYYNTQKLIYFIFDAQTLETVPWDTVVKKYMILKRYELTLHDLDSLNWTITYP